MRVDEAGLMRVLARDEVSRLPGQSPSIVLMQGGRLHAAVEEDDDDEEVMLCKNAEAAR